MRDAVRLPGPVLLPAAGLLAALAVAALSGVPAAVQAGADEADDYHRLNIIVGDQAVSFDAADLLARDDVTTVTFKDVSAYPRQTVTFKAVKFATLLEGLPIEDFASGEFVARDGFTANLRLPLLLNTSEQASVAYLAIEDPEEPWAPHSSGEGTAGPYYLFWQDPDLSGIGREEYPFKFNIVRLRDPLAKLYPEIVPDPAHPDAANLEAGFASYVKNCLACHQLGKVGPGQMGPDLNYPMSPVEYFRDGILRRYIRNPQSIRVNARTAMGPFPAALIPDQELDQLLAYLAYMAEKDLPPPATADAK